MDITPVAGIVAQPAPVVAAPALPAIAPAAPAAPMEPGRRVTANRQSGRSDLQGQQEAQKTSRPQTRGRLIDLSV